MISKINIWAQGIVIATIVATVIQLILPENKNKKYIKIVVGIYILFCIIHPVIGKSVNFSDYNLENYVAGGDFDDETADSNYGEIKSKKEEEKVDNKSASGKNGEEQYTKRINDEFNKRLIKDIEKKLNTMGYTSDNISVNFDNEYNINYLKILNIKKYDNAESIEINEVNICLEDENIVKNNANTNDEKEDSKNNSKNNNKIKESEKNKLKKYFCDVYKVNENEIEIS